MIASTNPQQSHQKPWWASDPAKSLNRRVEEVQRLNDPGTNADEMLKVVKVFIMLLLAFSALLGGMSYVKNFEGSFPYQVAVVLAVIITVTIEFGKNYCTTWALRMPFFWGLRSTVASLPRFLMWAGLIGVAAATFYMSVRNSTIGARQLSLLLAYQAKDAQADFTPNTADIDAQIAAAQAAQMAAQGNKITKGTYKGMTEWNSAKTAKQAGAAASSLIATKSQIVAQQRADWEARQARLETNRNYAANLVLVVGGWIEFITLLLTIIRVSCEKSLDTRQHQPKPAPAPTPQPNPIPTHGSPSLNGHPAAGYPSNDYHPTFFNRAADGNVRPAPISPPPGPADFLSRVPAEQSPILFKQTGDLFKQIWEGGRVVGLMYRKKDGIWQPLSFADVRSRWSIYTTRHENKPSPAVMAGREQWNWAMQQFDEGRAEIDQTIPASRFPHDKPIAAQVLERFAPLPMEEAQA